MARLPALCITAITICHLQDFNSNSAFCHFTLLTVRSKIALLTYLLSQHIAFLGHRSGIYNTVFLFLLFFWGRGGGGVLKYCFFVPWSQQVEYGGL